MKHYLLQLMHQEIKPAIGCTEIVAIAFAAANAKKYFKGEIEQIYVKASLNIFKNAKSVKIPFTNECGLELTAAIGAVCGDADDGLYVFKNVNDSAVKKAKELLEKGIVKVVPIETTETVYVEVSMKSKTQNVNVVLKNDHTHIEQISVNNKNVIQNATSQNSIQNYEILRKVTLADLKEIAEEIPKEDISFLLDGVIMNKFAAEQGLSLKKGLKLGASLLKLVNEGKIANDSSLRARIMTAAGADFRMSGGKCPVMTSGGSGNQGIGIIIPITVIAESTGATNEKLSRALFLGHAINLLVKSYTGKLAAICGCSIASGIGATAAIAWLLGGNDRQISGAVQNMLSNLTGMICDGAKESCALKLSTSAGEAVISAYLACNNTIVPQETGIIGASAEKTIENIGVLCKKAFSNTDKVLVDNILCSN